MLKNKLRDATAKFENHQKLIDEAFENKLKVDFKEMKF
jgi:hypothetical protein